MIYNEIKHVIKHFAFEGSFQKAEELLSGHINNTYHLFYALPDGSTREYVLQQINTYAFKKPNELMSNVRRVTEHLYRVYSAAGLDPARCVLHLVEVDTGTYMFRDDEDRYWRAYDFISGAVAYDRPESPRHFMEAGRAFGCFQRMLSDFPAEELYETIPDFHNTRKRFYDFVASVAADRAGRVKEIEREIDFFFDRRKMMTQIIDLIEAGKLPLRVTHNDTKFNNVMLDRETGEGLCVIDLDTVMAGSPLYDYGDAIRFGASTAVEDEPDLSKVEVDMELFCAFTKGFVSEVRSTLTPLELEMLPVGAKIMTCEIAMRFLMDYIDGDLYFKVAYPEHNLVRARAQMKLLESMEKKYDELCAATCELVK